MRTLWDQATARGDAPDLLFDPTTGQVHDARAVTPEPR